MSIRIVTLSQRVLLYLCALLGGLNPSMHSILWSVECGVWSVE